MSYITPPRLDAHPIFLISQSLPGLETGSWRKAGAAYLKAGLDPFAIALEHTHSIGLEFHVAYRLAGWTYPPPLDHNFREGYYQDHPELRCVDRDGKLLPRLSYAFREIQDYCLALLREMAQYPIDGICLLFNRRPPYIAYEAPLLEAFAAAHDIDPRELADTDPTWLQFRGGVMTGFMRRVREEMDAIAREQGRARRIEVSACGFGVGGGRIDISALMSPLGQKKA